jgi:predicted DNA-binding protein
MAHRVNVEFADSTYEALEQLARRKGKTKAATLRDVIALAKWIDDTREAGDHILVERNGKIREIAPV